MKALIASLAVIAGILTLPDFAAAACSEGELCVAPLGGVIADLYSYALRVVGLGVFVVFLAAGIAYVLPPSMRGKYLKDPNQLMWDAVAGTIILVSSVAILNIVNQDYTSFQGQSASSSSDTGTGTGTGTSTGTGAGSGSGPK
jgi:hypothetical protein